MRITLEKNFDYKDVFIRPQFSNLTSRSEVDTSVTLKNSKDSKVIVLEVPVLSANMDTVTDATLASAMHRSGGMGCIHRFMPIGENVNQFLQVHERGLSCFVSVGVNSDSKERATALYEAGARYFIIDIAHGHSSMMKDMIRFMRTSFGTSILVMAGNVASYDGCRDLIFWGADIVKIGIGPGAVCTTKNVTGVTVPQFSAVLNCCEASSRDSYLEKYKNVSTDNYGLDRPLLVADGGIQEIGDIAKALGAGADLVMCGRLFAGCKEAPGPRINGQKVYRGMASRDAMLTIREAATLPTPEGISTVLDITGETVDSVLMHIKGGLQSAMSYSNARNLSDFRRSVVFGLRR